jgi:putative metallohydrolase (TIGR04338 family)
MLSTDGRRRDTRRSRVYAAEDQVARLLDRAAAGTRTVDFFSSTLTLPPERRFADLASVQRWVKTVLDLGPVGQRWPGTPVCAVRTRRGATRAHYEAPGTIAVPVSARWALRELVLCHELAHHLVFHDPSVAADVPAHGGDFVEAYIDLARIVLGPEVALLLRAGFDQAGTTGVDP